jgi:RNA polymerase sigma factor (TIGR02999 family)
VALNTLPSEHNVTALLIAWENGDQGAPDQLFSLIYNELHCMASRYMRKEKEAHTLQTTALINELFCKIVDQKRVRWQNRAHFFGIAAQSMRRILIDHARKNMAIKRGGLAQTVSLDDAAVLNDQRSEALVRLDEALTALATFDERKSRIVDMKFFGGLSTEQIAAVERTSTRTIEREWRKAKAWLYHKIE